MPSIIGSQPNKEPILIVGTGALATLFAARLSSAGYTVTMLGSWKDGLEALGRDGARIDGSRRSYAVRVTSDPADCMGIRSVIVLVKSWQTKRAATQLASCLPLDSVVLTLQNGLGNDTILTNILCRKSENARGLDETKRPCITRGITTLGAKMIEPGLVHLSGEGTVTVESKPCLTLLIKMLTDAGFGVEVLNDAEALVWGKLVISASINPLTAILRVRNGELLTNSFARTMMGELARETYSLADSFGIKLPFLNPEHTVEAVAKQTAENQSSMLQDILRGNPTEIDAINGAVVQLASAKGILVPANRMAWLLVKALSFNGNIEI